jgi:hypothetical protein
MSLLLLAMFAAAFAVGVADWAESQRKAAVAERVGAGAEVLDARGVPLSRAGAIEGAIVGRYREGGYTYCHLLTVFTRGGQDWVSAGWGLGGCEDAAILGVLDLAGDGALTFADGWAGAAPQEPAVEAKKPALAVLTRLRYPEGQVHTELLVLDLGDLDRPFQVLRADAGTRLPTWDPREMPVQRSYGNEALALAVGQATEGPELRLTACDLPTPDSRCLAPAPITRRFLLRDGRFVEQLPRAMDPGCP